MVMCPHCSAESRPGARFCGICGAEFAQETPAASPGEQMQHLPHDSIPVQATREPHQRGPTRRPWLFAGLIAAVAVAGAALVFLLAQDRQDDAGPGSEPVALFPALVDGRYGFIDGTGAVKIEPQFDDAWEFSDGLAGVQVGGRWGFIDAEGEMVIRPKFDDGSLAYTFSEGLAPVLVNSRWGFVDTSGELVIPPQSVEAFWFQEGLALVRQEGEFDRAYAYIDKTGDVVISADQGATRDEMVMASSGFHDGLSLYPQDGQWGYIDKDGVVVVEPQFDLALPFTDGLAAVETGGLWGFIDKTGSVAIEPQFDDAESFHEGLAAVRQSGRWGFVDQDGDFAIKPGFGDVWEGFSEGLAPVLQTEGWGYIDKTGATVIAPHYREAYSFGSGVARVFEGGQPAYIDRRGRVIWETRQQ